jgi:hypothetical protein
LLLVLLLLAVDLQLQQLQEIKKTHQMVRMMLM